MRKKLLGVAFSLIHFHLPVAASPQQEIPPLRSIATNQQEIGIPYLRNFTSKEYGADVQNWAIVQDQRGVMYFGNNAGVLEYDGVSWRLIQTANRSAVRSLAIGDDGKIYVGTQGEIGYLSPDSIGQLRYVSLRDSVPAEYRDFADVAKIYATTAGVYFQALDRVFRWSNHQMQVWKPTDSFHLSFVVRDQFYIRQPGIGLLQMAGDSLQLAPDGEKFAPLRIYFMAPFGEDKILIGTREQGLFLYDSKTAEPFSTEVDAFLLENQIYHGAALSNNTFALATLRGGVAIIDDKGSLQQLLNKAAGTQDDNVKFVFPDVQGAVWLALNNGITRVEVPSPLSLYNERAGLKGDVASILRHRNRLYAATGQGLYYLQPRENNGALQSTFTPIASIAVRSFFLLSMGDALLTATSEGVFKIDGEQVKLLRKSSGNSYVLYRSLRDTNLVYVGLEDGLAALRLDLGNREKWIDEGTIHGINSEIRSIVETEEGILWLGTRAQGIIRVDFSADFRHNPKVESFDSRHGLPKEHGWGDVFSISEREVFITDKGIFRFDRETNRFLPDFMLGDAYADGSRNTGEAAVDREDNLWMQSATAGRSEIGVARRQANGSYVWLHTPFNRFADFVVWAIYPENDPAQSKVTWFGGPDGLIRYDAGIKKDYAVNFSALVRRISTIDKDSLIFGGTGLGENQSAIPPVLAYADNALRFEFAAPSFDNETANQFQYFLEGFDKSWSAWTKETKKDYTNLSEGNYQFRVRAKNIYEHVGAEAVYSFKISPPWYRTWWAYLFYLGVCAFSVYGFIKYRTRQLEQRSRALEKMVQQRTEEIQQQADELETLDGIVKVINQEVALGSVLRSLLKQGLKLFPQAEKASVLIFDHQQERFKFAAAAGYDLTAMQEIAFTPEQIARRYLTGSEKVGTGVFIIRDLQSLYDEEKLNLGALPKSVLAMAVELEGRLEGFLVFDNFSFAEAFDHSDARKLDRFHSHAISAIAKAKMLQELQEKNAEIIKTQEQLIIQEKLASLGGLTAGIAHEIKNPLNFVNNFAELSIELAKELREEISRLKDRMEEPAAVTIDEILRDLEQNAQKINQHGKRADSIVRGMLMHSRGHTGTREATDINAMLDESVNLAYHGLRAQDTSFNIKIEKDYDAGVGKVEVLPPELSRVFLNVISNACYATHEKKKNLGDSFSPTLSVRSKNLGDKIEIRIRDNGTGIPEAIRNKIFNPFFTTKPTGQGTGLGLSISYEIIVQKHKGEIKVETKEGQFTEFIIVLPREGNKT